MVYGTLYAGADYNLNLCLLQSRLQHIYPMSESTLTLCQSRLYPLVRDFGFGLNTACWHNKSQSTLNIIKCFENYIVWEKIVFFFLVYYSLRSKKNLNILLFLQIKKDKKRNKIYFR